MHLPTYVAVLSETPLGGPFNEVLALIGIAAIIAAIFRGIKSLMPQTPVAPPQSQPAPLAPVMPQPAPAIAAAGIAPEIIAVIAAAVATGSSRRIVSVKIQDPHWEKAGRQSILTSHRIR